MRKRFETDAKIAIPQTYWELKDGFDDFRPFKEQVRSSGILIAKQFNPRNLGIISELIVDNTYRLSRI